MQLSIRFNTPRRLRWDIAPIDGSRSPDQPMFFVPAMRQDVIQGSPEAFRDGNALDFLIIKSNGHRSFGSSEHQISTKRLNTITRLNWAGWCRSNVLEEAVRPGICPLGTYNPTKAVAHKIAPGGSEAFFKAGSTLDRCWVENRSRT
jgi:hypothetical protein